jgi:hypothetical protein
MGNIECPNCKSEDCFEDYYYKSGEVYVFCISCGYYLSCFYKRDSKGKLITKDGSDNFKFDNLIPVRDEIKKPYASYSMEYTDGGGSAGSLRNKKQYDKLVSKVVSFTNQENNIVKVTVSRLYRGKIKKEILYENTQKL